jgi:uncharacterized protein YciI
MHKLFILLASVVLFSISGFAQDIRPAYDSALAKKVGADDYGMKQYVMAFLRKGPNKVIDSAKRSQLIQGHLKNIGRMAGEGKLVVAGPFLDNTDLAGVYIFNVTTIEEAKALTVTDPAVKAGVFAIELHPWYGSALLVQVASQHATVQKKSITD